MSTAWLAQPSVVQNLPAYGMFLTDKYGKPLASLSSALINEVVWQLNDVGKLDYTISPSDDAANSVLAVATEVQLWYNGVLVWWGPNMTRRGKSSSSNWIAEDPLTLLKHRLILRSSEIYTSVDQFTIAQNLVINAQSGESYADLNIASQAAISGIVRSRLYDRLQHQDRFSLLQEFPGLNQGFDWGLVYDTTGTLRSFQCYYPQKGSAVPVVRLEWGYNVTDYDYNVDGHGMANEVFATGASLGGVRFENNYTDLSTPATYGVMHKVVSNSQVTDVGWLLEWAKRYATVYNDPPVSIKVYSVQTDDTGLIGVVTTGDTVSVTIQNGDVNIVDALYRVSEIHWKPGAGTVDFVFVPPLVTV